MTKRIISLWLPQSRSIYRQFSGLRTKQILAQAFVTFYISRLFLAKWPIRPAGVYFRFQEYLYSPLDEMLVHRRVTPPALDSHWGTNSYTWDGGERHCKSTSLQNRRNCLPVLGDQWRKRGECKARVAREGKSSWSSPRAEESVKPLNGLPLEGHYPVAGNRSVGTIEQAGAGRAGCGKRKIGKGAGRARFCALPYFFF